MDYVFRFSPTPRTLQRCLAQTYACLQVTAALCCITMLETCRYSLKKAIMIHAQVPCAAAPVAHAECMQATVEQPVKPLTPDASAMSHSSCFTVMSSCVYLPLLSSRISWTSAHPPFEAVFSRHPVVL